jgi:Fur family ferric uptake transcriptional regulator
MKFRGSERFETLSLEKFTFSVLWTHPNVSDIELLALPVLLQPVCKVEGVVQFKALECVESLTQSDLPAMVSRDVSVSHEHDHGHHHYFQCRRCEKVFDVPTCPGNLDKLAPAGFMVEDHEIILYGRCGACVEGASPAVI